MRTVQIYIRETEIAFCEILTMEDVKSIKGVQTCLSKGVKPSIKSERSAIK